MKLNKTVLRMLIVLTAIPWIAGCQSYSVANLAKLSDEQITADVLLHYGIPGASVAIIEEFTVKNLIHYGVKERGTDRNVDDRTVFQAASISKPITSIGIFSLIQRGDLDLSTTDVNAYLKSWKLDEGGFGAVTIGNLLRHMGGTTVSGFPGYDLDASRPTLLQVLSGSPPANTAKIRVANPPGKKALYSGGGYTVLQLLIEDTQNAGFTEWYAGHVLGPIGADGAFFGEPATPERRDAAALAHDAGGRRFPSGPWHAYPELAAAGLWISASDLVKIVAFVQKTLAGNPPNAGLLSTETALLMLSAGNRTEALKGAAAVEDTVAHGFFLVDKNNDGRKDYFSHSGGNWGYRCIFIAHMRAGYGAVVLTNSDNGNAACSAIIENIGKKHGWEGF